METKLIKFAQISTVIYSKTMFANVLKHCFISKMRQYISILDYYVVLGFRGPFGPSCPIMRQWRHGGQTRN